MREAGDRWRRRYSALAEHLAATAGQTGPHFVGFNSCIDRIHHLDQDSLARLTDVASTGTGPARSVAEATIERIASGRDGELVFEWPSGSAWLDELLGSASSDQAGGGGAQVAWALSLLGAPTVLATQDRSAAQLAVLPERCHIVADDQLVSPGQVAVTDEHTKTPHHVVEYSAGLIVDDRELTRSSSVVVRFANDGIERDDQFRKALPSYLSPGGAMLLSGMNGIAADDDTSLPWLSSLVDDALAARAAGGGPAAIHVELTEYPSAGGARNICELFAGRADSLGFNLAELRALDHTAADTPVLASRVAREFGVERVVVHCDRWAMCVHQDEPRSMALPLMTGNLVAGARAAHGQPVASPAISPDAVIDEATPDTAELPGGWRMDLAPSLYLAAPAGTVGLGDAFVAGLLVGATMPDLHWPVSPA